MDIRTGFSKAECLGGLKRIQESEAILMLPSLWLLFDKSPKTVQPCQQADSH